MTTIRRERSQFHCFDIISIVFSNDGSPSPCSSIHSFIMMPLKCSTASYQFRCHDEAYLFSTVDFISNFIFVSCQGKLRFEVSFIVFGCDNALVSAEERELWRLRHFQMKFAGTSPSLTIRMGLGRARGVAEANKRTPGSTVSRLSRWTFMIFMLRRFFHATKMIFANKQKEKSCNFFISARDNGPRPVERPEKRIRSCN